MYEQSGGPLRHGDARPGWLRWCALVVLGSAFFMALLDATIIYVALPRIQQELRLAADGVHWVMTAYLLGFGGLVLFGGRLAEVVGQRRMFLVGCAVFVAGSGLSGAAWSAGSLLAGRAVQGVGAAFIAPTTLPLLVRAFSDVPARRKALGVWTVIGALTGAAGLALGGPLTDGIGWRSVFLLNVPVGLAVLAIAPACLRAPDHHPDGRPARRSVDAAGALTLTATLAFGIAGMAGIGRAHWAVTVALLTASALAFVTFAVIEVYSREPLLPLYLIRFRSRGASLLVLLSAGVAMDGAFLLLTLQLQGVRGYSATTFGLLMMVLALPSVVGSFAGQVLAARWGLMLVAAASLTLSGAGLMLLSVLVDGGFTGDLRIGLLVLGSGLGAAFVAGQIAVVSGAPPADSLAASGLADMVFSVGGAIGLATVSTVLVRHHAAVPGQVPEAGYGPAFAVAAGLAAIGLVATLLLRRPRPRSASDAAPKAYGPHSAKRAAVCPRGRSVPVPVAGSGRADDCRAD